MQFCLKILHKTQQFLFIVVHIQFFSCFKDIWNRSSREKLDFSHQQEICCSNLYCTFHNVWLQGIFKAWYGLFISHTPYYPKRRKERTNAQKPHLAFFDQDIWRKPSLLLLGWNFVSFLFFRGIHPQEGVLIKNQSKPPDSRPTIM